MTITFDDLVFNAQPALQTGRKSIEQKAATEGRDWAWRFEVKDAMSLPVDLEAMGCTVECVVYTKRDGGTVLIELDAEIDETYIVVTATKADTAGLANGLRVRICPWRLTLTETATGRKIDVWGVRDSSLAILGDD